MIPKFRQGLDMSSCARGVLASYDGASNACSAEGWKVKGGRVRYWWRQGWELFSLFCLPSAVCAPARHGRLWLLVLLITTTVPLQTFIPGIVCRFSIPETI